MQRLSRSCPRCVDVVVRPQSPQQNKSGSSTARMQPSVRAGIGIKNASIAPIQTARSDDSDTKGWMEHRTGAAVWILSVSRGFGKSPENQQSKACDGWADRKLRCFSDFVNFPLAARSGYP
jgi:hypothetical protein